jgi:hypothetical protein
VERLIAKEDMLHISLACNAIGAGTRTRVCTKLAYLEGYERR